MRSRLVEITRLTEEFEWLDTGSRGWSANHWTEWPSVLHQALDRLAALPAAAQHQVTDTVEAWSVAGLGLWELGRGLVHEGAQRVGDAGHEARSEIGAAGAGVASMLRRAGRSVPGPHRRG